MLVDAQVCPCYSVLGFGITPFVAVYAYALLNERLTATRSLGAGLVTVGVLMLSWRPKAARPRSARVME